MELDGVSYHVLICFAGVMCGYTEFIQYRDIGVCI